MKKILLLLGLVATSLACQTARAFLPAASQLMPATASIPTAMGELTPGLEAVEEGAPTGPTSELATPIAQQPAAGICGEFEAEVVTITIYPDIPDPRCASVRADQRLRVVNARAEAIHIALAGREAALPPGEEVEFPIALGDLLAPGVHRLQVLPCCGAELWLRPAE